MAHVGFPRPCKQITTAHNGHLRPPRRVDRAPVAPLARRRHPVPAPEPAILPPSFRLASPERGVRERRRREPARTERSEASTGVSALPLPERPGEHHHRGDHFEAAEPHQRHHEEFRRRGEGELVPERPEETEARSDVPERRDTRAECLDGRQFETFTDPERPHRTCDPFGPRVATGGTVTRPRRDEDTAVPRSRRFRRG